MPAYKDEHKGTWYVSFYFENWTGKKEKKMKRGFATRREALEWERSFLQQKSSDMNMTFKNFVALYISDMKGRIKENTWSTKEHILYKKLVPYHSIYGVKDKDRIFPVTKSYLYKEMKRGSKEAGVKRIRVHDIRHSSISLLIDMGFTALAIADRVGHESIDITYRYAHLFPTRQEEMADKLNEVRGGF